MVGAADLGQGDVPGVAHAPLIRAPIDVFQHTNSAPALSPSTKVPEVAAVSKPSLTAAATTALPSAGLLGCLTPEQRASFPRTCNRLPTNKNLDGAFGLHRPLWLGSILCECTEVFFQTQNGFCLLLSGTFRYFRAAGQPSCHLPAPLYQPNFAQRGGRHSQSVSHCRSDPRFNFVVLDPPGGGPKQKWRCSDHCQEA